MSGDPQPSVVTVRKLPAGQIGAWDRLARGAFYSSSGWLSFVAADPAATTGFTLLRDAEGRLVGGLPVAAVRRQTSTSHDWNALLARRGFGSRQGDRLIVGPRRGFQATLLAEGAPRDVAGRLVDGVLDHAAGLGLPGAVALYLDTAGALALREHRPDALVLHLANDATIDLPGSTFEDYLTGLGSHRRQRVRRELADFSAAGYTVSQHPLADVAELAGPLVGQLERRYGNSGDPVALALSLTAQGLLLGDTQALLLHRGGSTVGFVSFIRHGDTLYLTAAGFDYPRLVGVGEYFNLAYYAPIRQCYERGIRRLHAGISATHAKALRGARLRPLWLVDLASRTAGPAGPAGDAGHAGSAAATGSADRAAAARYNAAAFERLAAELPSGAANDPADWAPFTNCG